MRLKKLYDALVCWYALAMGSPSRRSLQAAALASEGLPSKALSSSSSSDSPAEHLLKLASELKERIDVLRILDGTAPQWPGITNCIELLYDVAAEASEGLKNAYQTAQQSTRQLEEVSAKLQTQEGRADEAEDALAASNSENSSLSADLEQVQCSLERVQSELAGERAEKERKVCALTPTFSEHGCFDVPCITINCVMMAMLLCYRPISQGNAILAAHNHMQPVSPKGLDIQAPDIRSIA